MIKVKIFNDGYESMTGDKWVFAEKQVNEFIAEHNIEVIDVKFQVIESGLINRSSLLLIYKEKED